MLSLPSAVQLPFADDEMSCKLDAPLDKLRTPIRFEAVASSRGLKTVRDLVRLPQRSLQQERNFGEKSYLDTKRALEHWLGCPWETARAWLFQRETSSWMSTHGLFRQASTQGGYISRELGNIHTRLISPFRSLPVDEIGLPVRVVQRLMLQYHCTTVGELVDLPSSAWRAETKISRSYVLATVERLRDELSRLDKGQPSVCDHIRDARTLAEAWAHFVEALPDQDRRVIQIRCGVDSPAATLRDAALRVGLSREAVRRSEARTLATERFQITPYLLSLECGRYARALATSLRRAIDSLPADDLWPELRTWRQCAQSSYFQPTERSHAILVYLAENRLTHPWVLSKIQGETALTQTALDETCAATA